MIVTENIAAVGRTDPAIANMIMHELERQRDHIELIASENFASPAVMAAMATPLTNKYAEGYPQKRYYGGCQWIDMIEQTAIARAKLLFHAEHANVQPHSGAQANTAVYFAMVNPGDTVMGMSLSNGGHLTHGSPVNISGKYFNFVPYGVNDDGLLDYDVILEQAKKVKPKMIVAGASAYPRKIDFAKFREIADAVGAYLMVDMAHIAGLVAAGLHPDPVPYADFVTSTTHKTLRGPRGGLILCKQEYAKKIDSAIFPGTQGGPLEHVIAAKAVCFGEALQPSFKKYQQKILDNAQTLAVALNLSGFKLVSGGTDNHLMLLDFSDENFTGKEMETWLDMANITVNKNTVPNEKRSPFVTSGIRIGTPAVTTRGLGTDEMCQIAEWISLIADCGACATYQVLRDVKKLMEKYPLYE